jgi:hypothetical protein
LPCRERPVKGSLPDLTPHDPIRYRCAMAIAHEHNLIVPRPTEKPFGIRVSLRPGDPFARLIGKDWQKFHWFATEHDRDAAFVEMTSRHRYSRRGDQPVEIYEKVTR